MQPNGQDPTGVTEDDIRTALENIDKNILKLLQQRAAWVARMAEARISNQAAGGAIQSNHSARTERTERTERTATTDSTDSTDETVATDALIDSLNDSERLTDLFAAVTATRNELITTSLVADESVGSNPQSSTLNGGVLANRTAIESVFKDIDALCRRHVAPVKVAFLGPLGTYTHDAAATHFGEAMDAVPVESFAEIFAAVENGDVDYGVAPIENSTEGAVNQTHDLLIDSSVSICGEVQLRIRHCLMSCTDALGSVRVVHAHPQSLAQCRQWLNKNLPGVELVSESSNAAAADLATRASASDSVAAIASASAAKRYHLNLLAQGIEDVSNNTTRFVVIGRHPLAPTGNDATSLLISAPHKPGGLRRMLQPLEDAGVSMTRIESRPARTQMWEYVFFIDVKGHCKDERLANVLLQLQEETPLVRVLGSYPQTEA